MILKIAWKNILHKPLSSLLSWLLLSVSVGIIALLLMVQQQVESQFSENIKGVDMVLGAKGSPLQLILSAVYHVDAPTGNIDYAEARKWMKHPFVQSAIPLAYGDSYKGYTILGTVPAYITKYNGVLDRGTLNEADFEVVLGMALAKKLRLEVGSTFFGNHGNQENGATHKAHPYKVTGILKPTGNVLDNLIITRLESVWEMHAHEAGEAAPKAGPIGPGMALSPAASNTDTTEEKQEITAVLLKFRNPIANVQLPRLINENTNMMVAMPAIEINRMFSLLGVGIETLRKMAWGILFLSGLSVFIALFNSLKERRYELALLRTMGAGRIQLLWLLLLEGLILALAGFLTGMLLSRLALLLLNGAMEKSYHFNTDQLAPVWPQDFYLLLFSLLVVTLAAAIPAIKAYRLNISKTLSNG